MSALKLTLTRLQGPEQRVLECWVRDVDLVLGEERTALALLLEASLKYHAELAAKARRSGAAEISRPGRD